MSSPISPASRPAPDSGMLYVWGPRIGLARPPRRRGRHGDRLRRLPCADRRCRADGRRRGRGGDGRRPDRRRAGRPLRAEPARRSGWRGPCRRCSTGSAASARSTSGPARTASSPMPARSSSTASTFRLERRRPRRRVDVTKVRALGFRLDRGGRAGSGLRRAVGPRDRSARRWRGGFDGPGRRGLCPAEADPGDGKLLALAIMREERTAKETPEFEIGFDMLHMRFAGEDGAAASTENCGWVLGIAVRMAGELQENIGEDVKRVCDEPAATAPVINAIFDDRIDERIGALLRLAPASPLAMAVLTSSLRPVAPQAAEALTGFDSGMAQERWETSLAAVAENGRCRSAPSIRTRPGSIRSRTGWWRWRPTAPGRDSDGFADALFHYAYARAACSVRRACGRRCRSSSAAWRSRASSPTTWSSTSSGGSKRAPLDPAAAGVAEPPLARGAARRRGETGSSRIGGGDEAVAKRPRIAGRAGRGDEGRRDRRSDPAAAAAHYRDRAVAGPQHRRRRSPSMPASSAGSRKPRRSASSSRRSAIPAPQPTRRRRFSAWSTRR